MSTTKAPTSEALAIDDDQVTSAQVHGRADGAITGLRRAGQARQEAQDALHAATDVLRAVVIQEVQVYGVSQAEAARQAGVTRVTVGEWLRSTEQTTY